MDTHNLPEDCLPNYKQGIFDWKRRMGILQILTLIGFYLPEVIIIALGPIYLLPEPVSGVAMIVLLFLMYTIAGIFSFYIPPIYLLLNAAIAIVIPFLVITLIGHQGFEANARDDTNKNIKEFYATRNVIPLLLIFYYHVVELVLMSGYKPELAKEIQHFTQKEKTSEYYKGYSKIKFT